MGLCAPPPLPRAGDRAEIRINFNPLVVWVWYGGMLMALGGLIVMWPQSERKRQSGYVAEMAPQHREAVEVA
jgi:cytochrome c-type biogenesis protein CcmF